MKRMRWAGAALACALFVVGCNKDKEAAPAEAPAGGTAAARADTAGGMQGMAGMGTATMDQVDVHMRSMMGAVADSMKMMLPEHRQMVANMLSGMDTQMRQMNMKADAAWSALADSVRADLTRMPDLSATDLKAMMDAHMARVHRLMEMHKSMGAGMKM